jgi:hypothetical protein
LLELIKLVHTLFPEFQKMHWSVTIMNSRESPTVCKLYFDVLFQSHFPKMIKNLYFFYRPINKYLFWCITQTCFPAPEGAARLNFVHCMFNKVKSFQWPIYGLACELVGCYQTFHLIWLLNITQRNWWMIRSWALGHVALE